MSRLTLEYILNTRVHFKYLKIGIHIKNFKDFYNLKKKKSRSISIVKNIFKKLFLLCFIQITYLIKNHTYKISPKKLISKRNDTPKKALCTEKNRNFDFRIKFWSHRS